MLNNKSTVNQAINQALLDQKKKAQPFYVAKFKFIIVLITVIIIAPGYYLLIKPQYNNYKNNSAIINRLEKELQINLKQLSSNRRIISDYQSINQLDKEKINRILPDTPDLANLYVNLQAIVQKNNLNLTNLSAVPEKNNIKKPILPTQQKKDVRLAPDLTSKIRVNLELENVSYAKMKKLFRDLQTNLRLFDVISFDFSPSDSALRLVILTYNLKESQKIK